MSDNPLYMMNDLTEDELELIRMDRENRAAPRVSNRRRSRTQPAEPKTITERRPFWKQVGVTAVWCALAFSVVLMVLTLIARSLPEIRSMVVSGFQMVDTLPTAQPAPAPASAPTYRANVVAAPASVPAPQPIAAPVPTLEYGGATDVGRYAPADAPISPQAQPDAVEANVDQAAGTGASTVDSQGHVLPYNPADATAVADWEKALRNSGVNVDATATVEAEIACNADMAAGGNGCQP